MPGKETIKIVEMLPLLVLVLGCIIASALYGTGKMNPAEAFAMTVVTALVSACFTLGIMITKCSIKIYKENKAKINVVETGYRPVENI